MSPLKFVMPKKFFSYVKQRVNSPKNQVTTPPPPCWVSLSTPGQIKGATLWGEYICPPGIPYLVKSTQAVNGIHIRETKEAKLKGCNAERFVNA